MLLLLKYFPIPVHIIFPKPLFCTSLHFLVHTLFCPTNLKQQEMTFTAELCLLSPPSLSLCPLYAHSCTLWQTHTVSMVSYERLNPEDVRFSNAALSREPRPVREEVMVSSHVQCIPSLKLRWERMCHFIVLLCKGDYLYLSVSYVWFSCCVLRWRTQKRSPCFHRGHHALSPQASWCLAACCLSSVEAGSWALCSGCTVPLINSHIDSSHMPQHKHQTLKNTQG